ncbi:MAG: 3'-phosphoesterase [Bryobacterales bacterium]|nr:3'-phosphoesterase [Bryobacterales bacterium]
MKARRIFVVQEHHATRLHWDFRLEIGGVLKSWAVPKGPSLDPAQRRLAIQVPDHDMEHAAYEGVIPEGSYGAGPVLIWDKGIFETIGDEDPFAALAKGNLKFELRGKLLKGAFALIKLHGPGRERAWLLIKKEDRYAQLGWQTPVFLTPARALTLKEKMPACTVEEEESG